MAELEVAGVVAGYGAADEILKGVDFRVDDRRDRLHHRPERRRQIDAAQGDRRTAEAEISAACCSATSTSPARAPRDIARARRRLCAAGAQRLPHACRCARISRWAAMSSTARTRRSASTQVLERFPMLGTQAPPCGAHAVRRRAADARHGDGADGRAERAAARRAFRRPVAARGRTPVRRASPRSTARASSIALVEQNASEALAHLASRLHSGRRHEQPNRRRRKQLAADPDIKRHLSRRLSAVQTACSRNLRLPGRRIKYRRRLIVAFATKEST